MSLEFEYRQYLRKQERKQNRGKRGRDSERMKTYRAEWAFLSQVTVRMTHTVSLLPRMC